MFLFEYLFHFAALEICGLETSQVHTLKVRLGCEINQTCFSHVQSLCSWYSLLWWPVQKHQQDCILNGFPSPSPHSMLFGRTEVSSGELWWQSNIDRGRGEMICCGKWFSRSKFSFILKCLNSFVRDCSLLLFFFKSHAAGSRSAYL